MNMQQILKSLKFEKTLLCVAENSEEIVGTSFQHCLWGEGGGCGGVCLVSVQKRQKYKFAPKHLSVIVALQRTKTDGF